MNDSLKFRGGDASNPSQEFRERTRYKNYMNILKNRFSVRDTLYEHKHYGFLNKRYQIIQPLSGTDVISFGTYASDVFGLNFVVDQFNEFRNFYLNFSNESGLQLPVTLSNLIPQKSFENFDRAYQQHLSSIFLRAGSLFSNLINSRDLQRKTLSPVEFYEKFNKTFLFKPSMEGVNISKSGYAISSKSSIYETGIYVDLSQNLSVDQDYEKGRILSDPGFLCYLTFATEYGFSVDFNCPWRLVLNLEHPKTMDNILNGRPMEDYWDFYYDQYVELTGFSYDYYNIREFYENLYKEYYKRQNKLSREQMATVNWPVLYSRLFSTSIQNSQLSPGQFWVEIFVLNRLRESGILKEYQDFNQDPESLRIREHALQIYGHETVMPNGEAVENQVSTGRVGELNTGVVAYVTNECAEILKRKLTNTVEQ